jgi:hypothetical protein
MNFITSQHGIERLLCEYDVADAYTKSLQFFALSADAAFDMQETTAVFCHIMKSCKVNEDELEKQMQFLHFKHEELATSFKVKQFRVVGGRPRLRSKLVNLQRESDSVYGMHSFGQWALKIRFPNVFSLNTKHKLYFLMSQVHVPDPIDRVYAITRDTHVINLLKTAPVMKPDVEILHAVISSLKLTDEPFKELQDFRCECVGAFPVVHLNSMRLNDLLHLYVCAYQNPLVWKDVWKLLVPLLSHQVIRDVDSFTQKRPFNYEAVLHILNC